MANMDKWAELRTAYQVARLGTVSAAADRLGIHRATVNRHIDALEAAIGAPIFIRHARGYTLTEVGEDVLRVAEKTDALVTDLVGRVRAGKAQIDGQIKLTLLPAFAGCVMPAIVAFQAENPRCQVIIDVSEDLARLEYGEAHIALRVGSKPDHPDYVVRLLGHAGFNLYAHQHYVQRFGMPKNVQDLSGHRFVLPEAGGRRLPFLPWLNAHIRPGMTALSSRHDAVIITAMSAGIGLGFISDHEARARGDFQAVLPADPIWAVPLWLVTHVDLHRTEKVQAMLNAIKASPRTLTEQAAPGCGGLFS